MSITLKPRTVVTVLLAVIALLTSLSIASLYARFGLGYETVLGIDVLGIFHLDADVSVPGWYSASALLIAGGVVGVVAAVTRRQGGRDWRYWAGLALALCYLSADETARLHEQSAGILVELFERDSFFTRSWTVLAALAALAFAALYARFLLRLERRQRLRLFGAGTLYICGAVGMEVLGHYVVRRRFPTAEYGIIPYQTMVHLEEVMEMAAVVLLIYAALREVERHGMTLTLGQNSKTSTPTAASQPASAPVSASTQRKNSGSASGWSPRPSR